MKRAVLLFLSLLISNACMSYDATNGSDYIGIISLKKAFADSAVFTEKVNSLRSGELDVTELHEELSRLGVGSVLIPSSSFIEALSVVNEGDMLVYELSPVSKNAMMELGLIEKDEGRIYAYSFIHKKRIEVSAEKMMDFYGKLFTGRFMIITPGKLDLAQNDGDAKLTQSGVPDPSESQIASYEVQFYDVLNGENISLPSIVDLGVVPLGGYVSGRIEIKNVGGKNVKLRSVELPCRCMKNVEYSNTIMPGESGFLSFNLDPDFYINQGIIETNIRLSTDDPALGEVPIRITGIIDNERPLVLDPQRIFSEINEDTKKEFKISIFTLGIPLANIKLVEACYDEALFSYDCTFAKGKKLGKYSKIGEIVFALNLDNLERGKNEGEIVLIFDYLNFKRTYVIPYTFINTLK